MIVDIGYFAILAATVLVIFSIFTASLGIQRNNENLIQAAKNSALAMFFMMCLAYAALSAAFATDDFSVRFVAMNSSTDLPLFYKLTAVWGGMEGSLLLWQCILSFFTAWVVLRYRETNREILPHTLIVLSAISLFLLFLLLGWSNPFARLFPVPSEGNGLNPLLQNPGMVYHPPSLYLGYVGFSVPFAFAIGSLMKGKLDNHWIVTTRRWTLFSWFFLTLGMLLGAQWAYVELGWGGYWAWDPVENASLMPWLTGTAFLHSVIVQEKRNGLKSWNMVLIITTFLLSILGTFITRSGVLGSVHAFAKSNIGPAFLIFIAVFFVISVGLLLYRQQALASETRTAGFLCKENSFLLNNVVFLVMAFTVLYGTVFPLLAEGLANKKLSIQAPFFNSIMLPLAVITIILMGFTHFLAWRKTSPRPFVIKLLGPFLISLVLMALLSYWTAFDLRFFALGLGTLFSGILILIEWFQSFRAKAKPQSSSEKQKRSLVQLLTGDRRRKGGLIIHFGIVLFAVGVCGNFFNQETSFTFVPGETKQFAGYDLTFSRIEQFRSQNARNRGISVTVSRDGEKITELLPVKSFYPTSPQPMTEVDIHRSIIEDLYISLSSINEDGSATVVVHVNPMVNFIWTSLVVFLVGILYSLSYKPAQFKRITS